VGSEAELEGVEPVFAGLARGSGRVWVVVFVVVIGLCTCLACVTSLVVSSLFSQ
jgi:hypothetical protein